MPNHNSKPYHDFAQDLIPAFLTPQKFLARAQDAKNKQETIFAHNNHEDVIDLEILREEKTSQQLVRDGLLSAIKNDNIEVFMQPVLSLPQRQLRFYELYGRLRVSSGKYAPAGAYIDMAREMNILGQLDRIVLGRTIQILKKQAQASNKVISYFLNIRGEILKDKSFMNALLKDLSHHKVFAHRLIFELSYNDLIKLTAQEKDIISALNKVGCRFSVDQVPDIPENITQLLSLNIRFVKIAAKTLMKATQDDMEFKATQSRKQSLKANNITLIIQHVEDEKQLLECLDFDPEYGQGHLFGRPDFQSVYVAS